MWHVMDNWMIMDGHDENMRALIFPSNMRGSRSYKKRFNSSVMISDNDSMMT
jgi:hypothetical protein